MPRNRPRPVPSRLVRAAGALVWRFRDEGRVARLGERVKGADIEVMLVHRPRYNDWSWPKGKSEPGESLPLAAVREVEEEAGVAVALGQPLTVQRYRLGTGQTKEVHYWVGRVLPEGPALRARRPVARASRREIDEVRWVSPERAQELLTRRGDRRLLTELVSLAEEGLLVTARVLVVRHAKAVSRQAWAGAEPARPLTRFGVRQSVDLVDVLSAFGVGGLVSSPWERCRATLAPFTAAGASLREVGALSEAEAEVSPAGVPEVMESLVSGLEADEAVAMCVHRPTLPAVWEPLVARASARVAGTFPQVPPFLAKAEVLVAHVAVPASRRVSPADLSAEAGAARVRVGVSGRRAVVVAVESHVSRTREALPAE